VSVRSFVRFCPIQTSLYHYNPHTNTTPDDGNLEWGLGFNLFLMWAREEATLLSGWPSGANTPHQRAQPGSPRTHTNHAGHQTKGMATWLYPTPWIPVCVACMVWRAKAIWPRPRRGAGTPPGTVTLGQSSCVVWGKSDPISQISEVPGPPRKAQVLLVPTAAAASFLTTRAQEADETTREALGNV
jgi:hypothetical protein